MIDIDKHLNSYHDGGNDYRYVFSREEVTEIKQALEFYESALKNEVGYLSVMCERKGYNKAIDDFIKMAYEELLYSEHLTEIDIDYIAEQLKAGASDGNG